MRIVVTVNLDKGRVAFRVVLQLQVIALLIGNTTGLHSGFGLCQSSPNCSWLQPEIRQICTGGEP